MIKLEPADPTDRRSSLVAIELLVGRGLLAAASSSCWCCCCRHVGSIADVVLARTMDVQTLAGAFLICSPHDLMRTPCEV